MLICKRTYSEALILVHFSVQLAGRCHVKEEGGRGVRFEPAESICRLGLISIISAQLPGKNNADGLSLPLINRGLAYQNHSHIGIVLWEGGEGGRT